MLFSIWDTRVQDYAAYAAANPKADDSWKTQRKDGVPVARELDHPVVGVSWDDAQAFCRWLTEKEAAEGKLPKGAAYRLPTDEEWSIAVVLPHEEGTTPAEKNIKNIVDFPWGTDFPPKAKTANLADTAYHEKYPTDKWLTGYTDGFAMTSPVGSFPANLYGLYDMGGNVYQWCEDGWDASQKTRVTRGASWNITTRTTLLSSQRGNFHPGTRNNGFGFRCVLAEAAR